MARSRGPNKVEFRNLEKTFFPETGTTKGDILKYYLAAAPVLLPHFRGRPVTRIRLPDGIRGERFYEKNASGYTPAWVRRAEVPRSEGGVIHYLVIDDAETLAWAVNDAAIELHPFLHRADDISRPTHLAFDLDPGEGADLLTCIEVAWMVRDVLTRLGLEAYPKVSGSKGLQLYVPLNTDVTYRTVTPFARAIAELLHREHSDLVVSDMSKALRTGKVFIDWSQNSEKKTTVGPYSLRAKREQPYISAPVSWPELKRAQRAGSVDALFFSPDDVLRRIRRHGDLFEPVLKRKQRLPEQFADSPSRHKTRAPRSLERYAAKRDFSKTSEPEPAIPKRTARGSRRFVIQKHAASHLHYDFRLEMAGVLKSWAVPKGLSTELGVKRSAFAVEDHPLDYFSFEGVIPEGQYGGGTVMVWDIGTYEIIDGSYWKGDLKLWLEGKKLRGEWHLFRIKSSEDKPVWLVVKAKEAAKPLTAKQENTSVLTRRTMEQIAKAADAVWQSKGEAWETGRRSTGKRKQAPLPAAPEFIEPMLAQPTAELPADAERWIYEVKWDGYRLEAMKHGDDVRLWSRRGRDVTADYPGVADAVRRIHATTALLDGEIVVLDERGRPSFHGLQAWREAGTVPVYYAFDLLNLEGEDWRRKPLSERKERLGQIVENSGVLFSAALPGSVQDIVAKIRELEIEGVVAKDRGSKYESGERSGAWVKQRWSPEQEFLVGGFTTTTKPFHSLVVGYYDGRKLICAGKVPGGFSPASRREVYERIRPLRQAKCPFANLPNSKTRGIQGSGITAEEMKEIEWVKPEVVVRVKFVTWTAGGNLRHGAFVAIRDDKPSNEVVRET
jgi:bifunctional non-homologous end joining protein LigD